MTAEGRAGAATPTTPQEPGPSAQTALLRQHPLFSRLDQAILAELVQFAVVRRFGDGELVFRQGDPGNAIYGVLSGRVRIFAPGPDGGEITLNLLEPGELFGEIATLDGKPRTASAVAMETTALLQLRRDALQAALRRHPGFAEGVILLLCERLRWTSDLIEDAAFLPLPARLAKRLLALARLHGDAEGRIRLRLSQKELATLVGASRESVNKLLAQWRDQGFVELQRQRLLLLDPAGLARVADGTAAAA